MLGSRGYQLVVVLHHFFLVDVPWFLILYIGYVYYVVAICPFFNVVE